MHIKYTHVCINIVHVHDNYYSTTGYTHVHSLTFCSIISCLWISSAFCCWLVLSMIFSPPQRSLLSIALIFVANWSLFFCSFLSCDTLFSTAPTSLSFSYKKINYYYCISWCVRERERERVHVCVCVHTIISTHSHQRT